MTETEYGARFEDGTIMLRPSREMAMNTVRAIIGRGGNGALVTRQVTRTDWAEPDEALSKEAWHAEFPAIHPWHADGAACYRRGCAVLHEPKELTS